MTTPDDGRAVELEDRIAADHRRPMANALDKMLAKATALWVSTVGDLDTEADADQAQQVARQLSAMLAHLPKGPQPKKVLSDLGAARVEGVEQASREIGIKPAKNPRRRLDPETVAEVKGIPGRVDKAYRKARKQLAATGTRSYRDVVDVVATARGALTTTDRTIRWAANRAIAEGATQVAEEEGVRRVWVPEREACLHCLAYAGKVARAGEPFPAGLSFADRPLHSGPVANPPLHPNCRCRVQLWLGDDDNDSGASFPDGLVREAHRVVLRGRTRYASDPAKVRAAERLLDAGVKAPKSVKKVAEDAIARGKFQ